MHVSEAYLHAPETLRFLFQAIVLVPEILFALNAILFSSDIHRF